MPRVPNASDAGLGQLRTQPDAVAPVRLSVGADDFGARQGRNMQRLGNAADGLAQAMIKREAELAERDQRSAVLAKKQELDRFATKMESEILLTEENATLEFGNAGRGGEPVKGALQHFMAEVKAEGARLRDLLPDDRSRELFDQIASAGHEERSLRVANHEVQQGRRRYVRLERAEQDGLVNGLQYSPEAMADTLKKGVEIAERLTRLNRWDEDRKQEEIRQFSRRVHEAALGQLVNGGRFSEALSFLDQHGEGFEEDVRTEWSDRIRNEEQEQAIEDGVAAIFAGSGTVEEHLEQLRDEPDRVKRDRMSRRLVEMYDHWEELQLTERLQAGWAYYEAISEGRNDEAQALRLRLSPEDRVGVEALRRKMASGQPPQTNWGLKAFLDEVDPQDFSRLSLFRVIDQFSPDVVQSLIERQQQPGGDVANPETIARGVLRQRGVTGARAARIAWDVSRQLPQHLPVAGQMLRQVTDLIELSLLSDLDTSSGDAGAAGQTQVLEASGDDALTGDDGHDTITGGAGDDVLRGGSLSESDGQDGPLFPLRRYRQDFALRPGETESDWGKRLYEDFHSDATTVAEKLAIYDALSDFGAEDEATHIAWLQGVREDAHLTAALAPDQVQAQYKDFFQSNPEADVTDLPFANQLHYFVGPDGRVYDKTADSLRKSRARNFLRELDVKGLYQLTGQRMKEIGIEATFREMQALGRDDLPYAWLAAIPVGGHRAGRVFKKPRKVRRLEAEEKASKARMEEEERSKAEREIVLPRFSRMTGAPIKRGEFEELENGQTVDPHRLATFQDSAFSTFKDHRTIARLVVDLRRDGPENVGIPPVRVMLHGNMAYALDHRRLIAYRIAGVPVKIRKAAKSELGKDNRKKLQQTKGSTSVRIRHGSRRTGAR